MREENADRKLQSLQKLVDTVIADMQCTAEQAMILLGASTEEINELRATKVAEHHG